VSVHRLPAGHGQGTVAPQTRKNNADPKRPADAHSGAPAPLLTFQATAARCSVSVWTVRAWVDAGRLPVIRLPGRLVRVDPAALERFVEECR
jgi:excisionase family DNA binding protein